MCQGKANSPSPGMHQTGPEDSTFMLFVLSKWRRAQVFLHSAWSFCSTPVLSTPFPKEKPASVASWRQREDSAHTYGECPQNKRWVLFEINIRLYIKSIKVISTPPPPQAFLLCLVLGILWLPKLFTSTSCKCGYHDFKKKKQAIFSTVYSCIKKKSALQ